MEPTAFRINEEEMRYQVRQHQRTALMNLYNNVMVQTLFDFCLVEPFPRSAYYPGNRCQTSTLLQRLSSHLFDQLLVEAELSEIGLSHYVMYDLANALLDDSLTRSPC